MLGVGQRQVEKHPHVRIIQAVLHHPAPAARRRDDPVRPQPPDRMTSSRLAHASRRGQVADAHLPARQQRYEEPEPVRITQQCEYVRGLLNVLIRGHRLPDGGHAVAVHDTSQAAVQARYVGTIVHTCNCTACGAV